MSSLKAGRHLERTSRIGEVLHDGPSRTRTIAELDEEVGHQRSQSRLLRDDVTALTDQTSILHRRTTADRLAELAAGLTKSTPPGLLGQLEERGLSWRDIARALHVSVPAVRKWRQGEAISGDNRLRLARFVAICDLLEEAHMVDDVAGWFETPLRTDAPVTPLDVYMGGREDLVVDYAAQQLLPDQVLDHYDPDWRQRRADGWERFTATNGAVSLRMRRTR